MELSSFYLDILKDRLYCESATAWKRRAAAQTALYLIVDAMARMFAPILPFTCDDLAGHAAPCGDDVRNVVLNEMVQPYEAYALDAEAMAR